MKIYTHKWVDVHNQLRGFNQATGLHLEKKVLSIFGFEFVTNIRLWTDGEYTRKLNERLRADNQQLKTEKKNKKNKKYENN